MKLLQIRNQCCCLKEDTTLLVEYFYISLENHPTSHESLLLPMIQSSLNLAVGLKNTSVGGQSLFMPGRGQKIFSLIMEICHNPSISSLKFSRTPCVLAVIFRGLLSVLNLMTNF